MVPKIPRRQRRPHQHSSIRLAPAFIQSRSRLCLCICSRATSRRCPNTTTRQSHWKISIVSLSLRNSGTSLFSSLPPPSPLPVPRQERLCALPVEAGHGRRRVGSISSARRLAAQLSPACSREKAVKWADVRAADGARRRGATLSCRYG
jgi:hypothetical protein